MTVTVPALTRRLVAEFIGTGQLLSAMVGPGVMASRLSPHDIGSSDWSTPSPHVGAGAPILILDPVSPAHFNPVVSGVD